MPSTYKASTYAAVALWLEDSKVVYKPNPKHGKSFDRYAKYEKAATVGESLELGSKPEDLLFDYEHGLLRVEEPLRKERLDLSQVKDFDELTYTDRVLARFTARVDPGQKADDKILECLEESLKKHRQACRRLRKLEIAKNFGVRDVDCLGDSKGFWESGETFARRSVACEEARDVLDAVKQEGRKVSNHEMLRVLRLWGFRQNETRKNVMQEGQTWIWSDTLGATSERTGKLVLREESRLYPDFNRLCCQWLRDQMPEGLKEPFTWTSININKNYAGRLHRDRNNMGPSMIKAFGDFTGGKLQYWPEDDKTMQLADLAPLRQARVGLDLKAGLLMFDGNRAHEVDPFEGERYTVVFFNCARFWLLPEEERQKLVAQGYQYPTQASIKGLQKSLRPPRGLAGAGTAPLGRTAAEKKEARASAGGSKAGAQPAADGEPFRFWPCDGQDQLALEKAAEEFWRKRPAREVFAEAPKADGRTSTAYGVQRKSACVEWNANSIVTLGPELKSHKHLFLKGPANAVDASELLNADSPEVPEAIKKAGFCLVYSNRTKVYYLLWREGLREEACAALGIETGKAKKMRLAKEAGA